MWPRPSRVRRLALALALVGLAGCGGAARPALTGPELVARLCRGAQHAAAVSLRSPVTRRVRDPDPAHIECLIQGAGLRIDVVAQAPAQAWMQYDAATAHQSQAFGGGTVHQAGRLPQALNIPGGVASWVPAQQELIATSATPSRGGSYLTVTVTGRRAGARGLARSVGAAALALAPRGANPGTPPS